MGWGSAVVAGWPGWESAVVAGWVGWRSAAEVEEVRIHAWRVDVELGQICSLKPCCSRGGDKDTLGLVTSKRRVQSSTSRLKRGIRKWEIRDSLYGPRNLVRFFLYTSGLTLFNNPR